MNEQKSDWQATVIKILAVVTATPRWVGALLAAEGLVIPTAWADGWVIGSAIMSAAMAAVEGWAFSYVFEAWRNQEDNKSNRLGWLMLLSAILFVIVLAPYIAASVLHVSLAEILAITGETGFTPTLWLFAWSVAVGGSTIAIVASVGYAQKHRKGGKVAKQETTTQAGATNEPPQVAQNATESNRERVLALHYDNPALTQVAISKQVGISRQMVGKYIAQDGRAQS